MYRHGSRKRGLRLAQKVIRSAIKIRGKGDLPVHMQRRLSEYFESGQVTLGRER